MFDPICWGGSRIIAGSMSRQDHPKDVPSIFHLPSLASQANPLEPPWICQRCQMRRQRTLQWILPSNSWCPTVSSAYASWHQRFFFKGWRLRAKGVTIMIHELFQDVSVERRKRFMIGSVSSTSFHFMGGAEHSFFPYIYNRTHTHRNK